MRSRANRIASALSLLALVALMVLTLPVHAQTKISALPSASALTGTEAVPLVQSGTTSKSTPAAQAVYTLSGVSPTFDLFTAGNGTDLKRYRMTVASGGNFSINPVSDAGAVGTSGLQLVRTGTGGSIGVINLILGGTSGTMQFAHNDLTLTASPGTAPQFVQLDSSNTSGAFSFTGGAGVNKASFACTGGSNVLGALLVNGPTNGCAISSGSDLFGLLGDTPFSIGAGGTEAVRVSNVDQSVMIDVALQLVPVAVTSPPTCNAGTLGYLMMVNDANGPTYNAPVTGSGAVTIPVFCNGTNWTAH